MQRFQPIDKKGIKAETYLNEIEKILILQRKLKQEFILKETQAIQKQKLLHMIQDETKKYYTTQITNFKKGKAKIIEDQGFGDSYNFIKEVLISVCKEPKVLFLLLECCKSEEDLTKLIHPFTNVIYENIVQGEQYSKDIIKIIIQLLCQLLNKQRNPLKQLFIEQYLRRPEIIRYGKKISKNTLIALSKDQTYFPIPPAKIELKKSSSITKYDYEGLFYNYDIKKSIKIEGNLLASEEIIQKITYTLKLEKHCFSDVKLSQKSKEKQQMGEEQKIISIIENYLKEIFSTIYLMPIGIRIICKCLQLSMVKQQIKKEVIYTTIWKFLFRIYYDHLKFSDAFLKSRFSEGNCVPLLEKVKNIFLHFQKIEDQNQYFQKQVFKFIEELIILPPQKYEKIVNPPKEETRFKSFTACLSFEQIKNLFTLIMKIPEFKQAFPKISNRINRIYEMSDHFQIFNQCKTPKKVLVPNEAYILFQEFALPQTLSIDYHKNYQQTYKNDKIKNIFRQILVTLQPLEQYLIGYKIKSFTQLLRKLEIKYAKDEEYKGTDKIPIVVKIKYFLWLSKQDQIPKICQEMLRQYQERFEKIIDLYKETKVLFLRALQNLKYYRDRSQEMNTNIKINNLKQIGKNFLNSIKFSYCITSPKSRQKEFGTNGKLIITNFQKIVIEDQHSCIHTKNLQIKNYDISNSSHVHNVIEFIQKFCNLDEVRISIANGQDKVGINANIFWFIGLIVEKSQENAVLKINQTWFKQYIQDLLTRKINHLIFPRTQTYKDLEIYSRILTLDWILPSNLKINVKNRIQQVWQLTSKCIRDLEKSSSTSQKFQNIKEFMKIINGVLFVNDQGGVVDNIFPMIVYSLLRTKPQQIYSNLNFIEIFTEPSKMLSSQGYCFTNMKSSILYIENLTEKHLIGVTKQQMEKKIYEKEMGLGIPFLRRSKSSEYGTMAQLREKINVLFHK